MREYHGLFKNLCSNFCIDPEEFIQIFKLNSSILFEIWDTKFSGVVDALELFSGLIVFADAKAEDKIRCKETPNTVLFEIFDFNELNSLSMFEIEYMIHCVLVSSFKIYSITKSINQEELSLFIDSHFFEDARINISQLIKWACQSREIADYFTIIKQEPPKMTESIDDDENMKLKYDSEVELDDTEDNFLSRIVNTEYIKPVEIHDYLSSAEYKQMNSWFIDLFEKINHHKEIIERQNEEILKLKGVEVELEWVYGFRCTDTIDSFSYFLK